jgi:cysteinyl-tRNA synthetase
VTREALVAAAEDARPNAEGPAANAKTIRDAPHRALSALDNDLNTSVALSVIAELAKVGNEIVMQIQKQKKDPAAQAVSRGLAAAVVEALDTACAPLGILQTSAADFFARARARRIRLRGLDEKAIEAKVKARTDARASKDFARADAVRKELAEMGVELQDVAATGATTWKVTI